MQKNTRLSEIDNEVEELCHQMNDAWSKNDIETLSLIHISEPTRHA